MRVDVERNQGACKVGHLDAVILRCVGARVDGARLLLRADVLIRADCVGHTVLQVVEVSIVRYFFALFKVSVTNCYIFLLAKALRVRKRRVDQW